MKKKSALVSSLGFASKKCIYCIQKLFPSVHMVMGIKYSLQTTKPQLSENGMIRICHLCLSSHVSFVVQFFDWLIGFTRGWGVRAGKGKGRIFGGGSHHYCVIATRSAGPGKALLQPGGSEPVIHIKITFFFETHMPVTPLLRNLNQWVWRRTWMCGKSCRYNVLHQ